MSRRRAWHNHHNVHTRRTHKEADVSGQTSANTTLHSTIPEAKWGTHSTSLQLSHLGGAPVHGYAPEGLRGLTSAQGLWRRQGPHHRWAWQLDRSANKGRGTPTKVSENTFTTTEWGHRMGPHLSRNGARYPRITHNTHTQRSH